MLPLLKMRTWRNLRLTAWAHGFTFHSLQTRAQAYEHLYHRLIHEGTLRRCFKRLDSRERAGLLALHAAGGTLPLWRFQKAFGKIRAYRPWRCDTASKQPWKAPQSAAEKLWHLGFVEIIKGKSDYVALPDEVRALLPPLPKVLPLRAHHDTPLQAPCETLCIDLAALLGTLLARDVRALHGRWLPPSALRAVNERLRIRENLDGVRSELQSGRLRFLHYLAEAAGLVAVQGALLKPTVQAWRWLDLPPAERWRALWRAVMEDVKARHPLWQRYRLPAVDVELWTVLTDNLPQLSANAVYAIENLRRVLQPHLPTHSELDIRIPALLREPLMWLGVVSVQQETFTVLPHTFTTPQNALLTQHDDALYLSLPAVPRLHALVTCCDWAGFADHQLVVDAMAVTRALENGSDALKIAAALTDLIGESLPAPVFEQIAQWACEAQSLTLRSVALLTARDSETLAELHADWRLRPLFAETLSPHHTLVTLGHVPELLTKLERRGYRVTNHLQQAQSAANTALSPAMSEYLWLALRVYQKLGTLVEQEIRVPGAALDEVAAQLPASSLDGLESESEQLMERLRQAVDGKAASPPLVRQDDTVAVRAALRAAYDQRGTLTIEYFSPARGEKTIRTIEPTMLYAREGVEYVEAWCRLADDARTFRVDRIVRVVDHQCPVCHKCAILPP